MKFMLDTNICIYLIKRQSKRIIENLKKHTAGEVGLSSITLAELQYGVAKSQHRKQNRIALEEFVLFGLSKLPLLMKRRQKRMD